jgi:hypothetical protein
MWFLLQEDKSSRGVSLQTDNALQVDDVYMVFTAWPPFPSSPITETESSTTAEN